MPGVGAEVADEDVVNQVGGRGKQPVVGGGNDLGEDGSDQKRAEQLAGGGARRGEDLGGGYHGGSAGGVGNGDDRLGGREAVEADVGEDLAGTVVDFAGGEDGGAGDGEGYDDGLEDEWRR